MELSANILHINKIPFLISISKYSYHSTIRALDNLSYSILEFELKNIIYAYTIRWFQVVLIGVNIQFKALNDRNLVTIPINIVTRREYVKKVE